MWFQLSPRFTQFNGWNSFRNDQHEADKLHHFPREKLEDSHDNHKAYRDVGGNSASMSKFKRFIAGRREILIDRVYIISPLCRNQLSAEYVRFGSCQFRPLIRLMKVQSERKAYTLIARFYCVTRIFSCFTAWSSLLFSSPHTGIIHVSPSLLRIMSPYGSFCPRYQYDMGITSTSR